MADGIFPGIISKDRDLNALANPIIVQLSDGTSAVGVTAGALDVNLASGSLGVDFSYVDDSAFTVGTDKVGAIGCLADETTPDSVDEGDVGIPRMTLDRKQIMVIADPTNDARRLVIDASGFITSNINGTVDVSGSTVDCNGSDVTVDNGAGASAVNIQDGGNSITVDGTVGISGTVAVTQSGVWDIGTVTTLTGITNDVNIADGGNSITVDGTVAVSSIGGTVAVTQSGVWDIGTVTTLTGITNDVNIADGGNSITVDALNLDIRDLTHVSDSVAIGDGTDTLEVTASGSAQIDIAEQSLTAVKISKDANANSELNPIFVKAVDTAVSASEIHDFDQASAVSAGSTNNHDYTVANTTMLLKSIIVSASGNAKFEVQVGALASLATVAVGFLTGREGDTKQIDFNPPIEVPVTSTGTVRVAITNRQNQAQDLYSTIIGNDV